MFGFLKYLLGKPGETPTQSEGAPAADNVALVETSPEVMQVSISQLSSGHKNGHNNGRGIELQLQLILNGLPLELQSRVRVKSVGNLTVSVALEKVLSQLAQGVVRISFGELRHMAPQVFSPEADRDRVLVPLPLGEILAQLNPALILRRRVQRQIVIPNEISSPFDPYTRGITPAPSAEPDEIALVEGPAVPAAPPLPPPRPTASAPRPPLVRSTIISAPTPPPPTAPPLPMPALPLNRAFQPDSSPAQPSEPVLAPQAAIPMPECATPETAAAGRTAPESEAHPLTVGLTSLAEGWPEAVRREIVQMNLVDAKVALPGDLVERALKKGRISFTWRMVRSWLEPTMAPTVSPQDGAVLELPLKVVAPLFLARQRERAKSQPKVSIDENIPNLFFGFPQPDAPTGAAATPADTNYYVWDDTADQVQPQEIQPKSGPSPGTKFVAKYATPNEIVSRAAALDGVAGALIALPDGLLVASRLSPDLNADTLAAFLPQIFGKVSQCTKELRMGELNNLNFTVGNVPWKIFRVNAIFFAAFGRAGQALPTAQLAALAAELDHKPK